jgi:transposase
MDKRRVEKAIKLLDSGKSMTQAADQCHVHVGTLRKWIRNYERSGDSLFTKDPEEIKRE